MGKRVWILGMGRSGSTALTYMIGFCGIDLSYEGSDNITEHDDLVRINDAIIAKLFHGFGCGYHGQWYYHPLPFGYYEWLFKEEQLNLAAHINKYERRLPDVLKDPRWSITLPLWYRYANISPDVIIRCKRDICQCARSWTRNYPELYSKCVESLVQKGRILNDTVSLYKQRGVAVIDYNYPIDLCNKERTVILLCNLFDLDKELATDAYCKVYKKDLIHRYDTMKENQDGLGQVDL